MGTKRYQRIKQSLSQIGAAFYMLAMAIALVLSPSLTKPASAAVSQVNSTNCNGRNSTTLACSLIAPTDGNTLVAVIGIRNSTNPVTSISQTGATWTQATSSTGSGYTISNTIWYANNFSSAGTTATINMSCSCAVSAVIVEYSGLKTSSVLDQTATNSGSSTSPDSGTTATTSQAEQLWVGGFANEQNENYSSPTNSFTLEAEVDVGGPGSEKHTTVMYDRIVSSTGTANVGATLSATQNWTGSIATFNAKPTPTQISFTTAQRTITAGACSGSANVMTIEIQDSGGSPATPSGSTVIRVSSNSTGTVTFYSDDTCSSTITSGDITFTTSDSSKSFYMTDTRKSSTTWTLTASQQSGPDTLSDGTQDYTVNAGAVSRLVITLPGQTFTDGTGNSGSPSNRTAGSSFTITSISATDDYFNVNTGYGGSKTLVYSGPSSAPDTTTPSYTTAVSFTNGQSTTTLTTTLYAAESTTITATDGGSYGHASSSVTVDAGILDHYDVTSSSTNVIAGACTSGTITAKDAWNNTRSNDTTTVNYSSTGTSIYYATDGACGGLATDFTLSGGTATFYWRTTEKQSGFTITMTNSADTQSGTTGSLTVDPDVANALLIKLPGQSYVDGTGVTGSVNFSGLRTPNATAGTSFNFDVIAIDQWDNRVDTGTNNYNGSKTISFSNSTAGNAPDSTAPSFPSSPISFTNGVASGLTATYYNAATGRTVQADDTGTPVSGTASTTFTVSADTTTDYDVSAAASQTAGVSFNVTITALDQYQNQIGSDYSAPSGTYTWSTTASNAPDSTAPSIGTLVQGDFTNGVATKSVTLYNNESGVTFSAGEPSPSTVNGTTGSISVAAGEVSAHVNDSSVTGPATATASNSVTITITLLDTWENPVSGVATGNITVSGTGSPTITQPSSATNASGQTTADASWAATGTQTISVQISGVSLVQDDGSTADADGLLDDTHDVNVSLGSGSSRLRGGSRIQGGTILQ